MNRKFAIATALAAALTSAPVLALNEKTDSPYDYRIKTVIYNPMDVVQIDGVVGLQTLIQFAQRCGIQTCQRFARGSGIIATQPGIHRRHMLARRQCHIAV